MRASRCIWEEAFGKQHILGLRYEQKEVFKFAAECRFCPVNINPQRL